VATATLRQLLAGPTAAERRAGYWSPFSAASAGTLRGLRVGNGVAHADFHGLIRAVPTAGSSAGTAAMLSELDTTLRQFPTVRTTVYSLDGDVAAFYEWLQLSPPVGMPPGMPEARRVAEDWLRTVVGMPDVGVVGAHWRSDSIATVDVRLGRADGEPSTGPLTTVVLARSGVSFTVLEAVTDTLRVDRPASGISPADVPVVSSPLSVVGRALTFEGTVDLRVVQVDGRSARTLGRGFATAAGDALAPYAGQVRFARPRVRTGWLLAAELSAYDGAVTKVTAVRVLFAGVPPAPVLGAVRAVADPPLPELATEPGEGLARDGWVTLTGRGTITLTVRATAATGVRLYLAPLRGDAVGPPRPLGTATRSGAAFVLTWRYADEPLLARLSVVATGAGQAERALVDVYHG
jgi:hypothetical protein